MQTKIDFQETIKSCLEKLQGIPKPKKNRKNKQTWSSRMESTDASWDVARKEMLRSFLSLECQPEGDCDCCQNNPSIIYCDQCHKYVCYRCDHELHSCNVLHDRFTFSNGLRVPLLPTEILNEDLGVILTEGIFQCKIFTFENISFLYICYF